MYHEGLRTLITEDEKVPLEEEIKASAKEIVTDGYEMSVGELSSLYKDGELIINPDFQRYFRWELDQKTRFIESLLLGIPIPPIFVFQTTGGQWELVDGLQRLSTIFEFMGILKTSEGGLYAPTVLEGTRMLPSLMDKRWAGVAEDDPNDIGQAQRLFLKRARIRVEILKKESDPRSKYELFTRLNTGGSALSEQEARNCVLMMVNKDFFTWIEKLSTVEFFKNTLQFTDDELERRKELEFILRFLVYRNVPYRSGLDVHEYLEDGMLNLATRSDFQNAVEESIFVETFRLLDHTLGSDSFKRFDGTRFRGKKLLSAFEMIATGLSWNLDKYEGEQGQEQLKDRIKSMWTDPVFDKNSGAGVRGTTRLSNLLPYSREYFGR